MDEITLKRTSKFLSLVLRHKPETVDIQLDEAGWVDVAELLAQCSAHGKSIPRELLDEVVATNSKKRFAFSEDGLRIRANQGHSVDVSLGYEAQTPPQLLFHGTVGGVLDAIREGGLNKMERHHVHLSADRGTAANVGQRRGKPVILLVRAADMVAAGHEFFLSTNGVWLTESVPPEYIHFPAD